jgi:[ribosomal protein S5]-alanine N-acetyltransferase
MSLPLPPLDRPELASARLRLRPFRVTEAARVSELAGRREIADTTISIPHPFPTAMAERWIESHETAWRRDEAVHFAVELVPAGLLIGGLALRHLDRAHFQAELGFWIGTDWWGRGYATEAVEVTVGFAMGPLGLNRLYAHYLARNAASGRVLEKTGFRREGLLRQRVLKWGRFEDVVLVALLRRDYAALHLDSSEKPSAGEVEDPLGARDQD